MRKFLDVIRAQIANDIVPDGEYTANELAPLLTDLIDSTVQDEASVFSTGVSLNISTTPFFTPLNTVFGGGVGGDGDFLLPEFTQGRITSGVVEGFTYIVHAHVNFTDLPINKEVNFTILQDGIQIGTINREQGAGNNKVVGVSLRAYSLSTAANSVFQLGIRTPGGSEFIDILECDLSLTIVPTKNP